MPNHLESIKPKALALWHYCAEGVWADHRNKFSVRLVKTANLTVRSFMDSDLQSTACALTFRLLLALVPALALLFAIGRGFGFENLLATELFRYFPSQQKALETAMRFVDSYLSQASEGLFVGVGIIVLLWTLISLISSVEAAFNSIWGVKRGRSLWRKITDYTAIFLILPILMVSGAGLTVFMSTTISRYLPFVTPIVGLLLDLASVVLIWLFFTGCYMLIPNARVKFRNALPAGILAGITYQVLQWLFVGGQIYVSKYNAIYGGFAFLPLLLVWLQLVWLFTLTGALICCSAQSISDYAPKAQIEGISPAYKERIALAMLSVIAQRYNAAQPPLTLADFNRLYNIPRRLASNLLNEMEEIGLLSQVLTHNRADLVAWQPAHNLNSLTLGQALSLLRNHGSSNFVHGFDSEFASLDKALTSLSDQLLTEANAILTKL